MNKWFINLRRGLFSKHYDKTQIKRADTRQIIYLTKNVSGLNQKERRITMTNMFNRNRSEQGQARNKSSPSYIPNINVNILN